MRKLAIPAFLASATFVASAAQAGGHNHASELTMLSVNPKRSAPQGPNAFGPFAWTRVTE